MAPGRAPALPGPGPAGLDLACPAWGRIFWNVENERAGRPALGRPGDHGHVALRLMWVGFCVARKSLAAMCCACSLMRLAVASAPGSRDGGEAPRVGWGWPVHAVGIRGPGGGEGSVQPGMKFFKAFASGDGKRQGRDSFLCAHSHNSSLCEWTHSGVCADRCPGMGFLALRVEIFQGRRCATGPRSKLKSRRLRVAMFFSISRS